MMPFNIAYDEFATVWTKEGVEMRDAPARGGLTGLTSRMTVRDRMMGVNVRQSGVAKRRKREKQDNTKRRKSNFQACCGLQGTRKWK